MKTIEANFDGLVGPTHNYAGLSLGNKASANNAQTNSNPKEAALQGLQKMKNLHDMGFVQGVLAPQERPDIHTLRHLGFRGSDHEVLKQAAKQTPQLLASCCSASSMWTANAATVSPSADCSDNRVHFTPANLSSMFHRSIEHDTTGKILKAVFNHSDHFVHHLALPSSNHFGDEGAANHTRFCQEYGDEGVEFFVFGKYAFDKSKPSPSKFPARQTFEASQAVSRSHQLNPNKVIFAQQNPNVIDQGVFHNDVIAVGNRNILFCHEQAFLNQQEVYQQLTTALGNDLFNIIEVPDRRISVKLAIKTYLFNSQLLTLPNGETLIIVPDECRKNPIVWDYLQEIIAENTLIHRVEAFDLHQSMNNGGGPACLRLRVVLNEDELKATNQSTLMNSSLFDTLNQWINKHYRDRLSEQDLADPQLLTESRTALDELTRILQLGSIYDFQY
ncbi:N-succinylarginine dihydrolase [Endozoicomonas sp. (ex Bugula neritina AB1)]|nr:N-succinylarginine dihydrolase [Endozoicomonas sp. (ex Bugula neritina AB1)]